MRDVAGCLLYDCAKADGLTCTDARVLILVCQAPAKRVDLELMCRVGEDGTDTGTDTLDLHVNFAGYYYPVVSKKAGAGGPRIS